MVRAGLDIQLRTFAGSPDGLFIGSSSFAAVADWRR
jgi:hypothetical protein